MLGICISFFRKISNKDSVLTIPNIMVYSIAIFYVMFYLAMGMVMTWAFFWFTLAFGIGGAMLGTHLLNYHRGSGKAVYLLVGILSFMTVMLGGYSREASRPRFVDRIAHYDKVFVPEERQPYLMIDVDPDTIPKIEPKEKISIPASIIRERCSGCHTLDRVKNYSLDNWDVVVRQMEAYGLDLTNAERKQIVEHLESNKPY
jgi:hypothetical protein